MSESPAPGAPAPPATPARAWIAVALAWLLPGLGHVFLGWPRRGLLYAAVLLTMFVTGVLLDGTLSRWESSAYLARLATIADLGNGLPYVISQFAGWGAGRASSATHEAGNAFHWSAGIMNMLLMVDAWDIATRRKTGRPAAA